MKLNKYIHKVRLTLEDEIAEALVKEITDRRAVVHTKQRDLPLTLEEVVAAIRGRHRWNVETKSWDTCYRPMWEYWIILLKTISDKIFTLPPPEIKPQKILAQYELNEIMLQKEIHLGKKVL